jgi:protein phosphatase
MEDVTAEYTVEQLLESPPLRVTTRLTIACKTDVGRVRENNEDKFEYYLPEDEPTLATRGAVFLVCDGMGGHAAGQIASELAAKTFLDVYYHHPATDPVLAMHAGVQAANRYVLDNARAFPARRGMGCTLSGLVVLQDEVFVVQVGDSRVYRLRDENLERLMADHTWIHEALEAGHITAEESINHPYRHVLTRAIGTEEGVAADVFRYPISVGDRFLLCSDGLLDHLSDAEIAPVLAGHAPSEAAWKLVGSALQAGGSDNTTVLIVRIDELKTAESA